ncbi:MAG: hypothetical protein EAZ97_00010 [Bacteroidetes bacterium]|nr:MAG: hypothetical protein EAZ97_00010 [Bacteroidota bacterium]
MSQKIEQQNFENFIFVGYSHGEQTGKSLLCNKSAYVDEYNVHLFKNTLFYAMACSTGAKLAHQLIEKECWTFIGFNKVVQVVKDYQHIAQRCDNWGIMLFLGTDISIGEAFSNMKQEFTKQIDILEDEDFGSASWLVGNRDALVLYGNKNLTRQDFM